LLSSAPTCAHPPALHAGQKNLEVFGGSLQPGEVLFALQVATIHGKQRLLTGSAFRCGALAALTLVAAVAGGH
jgi:hypothetical protein